MENTDDTNKVSAKVNIEKLDNLPNKVLSLDMYFKLPDDFEGTETEALELFMDCWKNGEEAVDCETEDTEENEEYDEQSELWKAFLKGTLEGRRLCYFADMISFYDKDSQMYVSREGVGE